MLAIEERFKYVGTAEKYLDAAKAAMNFINTRKRTDEEGIYWTLADAAAGKPSYYDEICVYAGASGIICFLLSLYEDTQDAAYLDEARNKISEAANIAFLSLSSLIRIGFTGGSIANK